MIIDSSALIEIIKGQPDAERCSAALLGATVARISAANLLEVCIVADGLADPDAGAKVERLLELGRIKVEPVAALHAELARLAYRRFGRGNHPAKLNFGDCFAYALAKATDEPLLFVGNDFSQTDLILA